MIVTDDATAEQPIERLTLRSDAPVTRVTRPGGWFVLPPVFAGPEGGTPGVTFAAEESEEIIRTPAGAVPPPPAAIKPGRSLSGFSPASRYPPGHVRTDVQGFAPVPFLPAGFDEPAVVPDDTTNSRRGWTLGPTRYARVAAGRRTAADDFLVVMLIEPHGRTLRDPAPVALDLAAGGETVFREALRVELNGQDMTAAFHPGPPDGADLAAVLRLGASPLNAGRSVLTARIEGVPSGVSRRAVDAERIVFHVQPWALPPPGPPPGSGHGRFRPFDPSASLPACVPARLRVPSAPCAAGGLRIGPRGAYISLFPDRRPRSERLSNDGFRDSPTVPRVLPA